MKIFVTRYWATAGIMEFDADVDGLHAVCGKGIARRSFYGSEWHPTRGAAIAHAEELKIRKLKALDRQIKKISAMEFK